MTTRLLSRRPLYFAAFLLISVAPCFLALQLSSAQTKLRGTQVVDSDEGGEKEELYAQSWALVIGVRKYTNGWPELNGAADDIKRVKDALEKQGFTVETLPDPTRDTFNQTLERFINEHGSTGSENNRLLIYFAGHGETLKNPDGRQLGFIVPADAPLPQKNEREFRRLAISMDKIDGYARDILAKHVLFIFDSCFAGSLFEAVMRSGPSPLIKGKASKPVRQFITAGTENQSVPDKSIFCDQLLKGLGGAADRNNDGYITGEELGMFLEEQVTNYSNRTQTPKYGKIRDEKLDKGDFVFINPAIQALPPARTTLPKMEVRSEQLSSIKASAFSNDGRLVLVGDADNVIHIWDLIAGKEIGQFTGHTEAIQAITFSPDGRTVISGGKDHNIRLWDIDSKKELQTFVAISPDGRQLMMATINGLATVFDADKRILRQLTPVGHVSTVLFSHDGSSTFTISETGVIEQWELSSGRQLHKYDTQAKDLELLAFSPDQKMAALVDAGSPQTIRIFELETNQELRRLTAHGDVRSITFSPDGKTIISGGLGCPDRNTVIWDVATGMEIMRLAGQSDSINTVSISPSGRFVLAGGSSGAATLWDITTGNEIARLITFRNGPWAVIDPEGRFDTSDLEQNLLYWLTPDNPLRPLPLAVFTRQFYEPNLLSRTLAGEKFEAIPLLDNVNTTLPAVQITQVKPGAALDRVTITVEARSETETSNSVSRESGINNIRLFRDGQLVGHQDGEIKRDENGKAQVTFADIALPHNSARQVEFSVYAFNSDKIKSATTKYSYSLPKKLPPQKGRAYIISMGVNTYDTPEANLRFAVNDVLGVTATLGDAVRKVGNYAEVIPVSLISDGTSRQATKRNLETVLGMLAGKKSDAQMLSTIAGAGNIRKATPNDLVVIYLAGHGYIDKAGEFYFLPSDIGKISSGFGDETTNRFVSSNELALWLREVDAGDSALIIDASHSGAALNTKGDLTLRQVAYDKSMKVLTASQAESAAIESAQLSDSLLAYSLIEGLTKEAADINRDGRIMLTEWLAYAVERVPSVLDEFREKSKATRGTPFAAILVRDRQQPILFDLGQKRSDVILLKSTLLR